MPFLPVRSFICRYLNSLNILINESREKESIIVFGPFDHLKYAGKHNY